jgi:hypothetical protein
VVEGGGLESRIRCLVIRHEIQLNLFASRQMARIYVFLSCTVFVRFVRSLATIWRQCPLPKANMAHYNSLSCWRITQALFFRRPQLGASDGRPPS